VETYRLLQPIERVGAWLYRVARNRIIDSFRKKRPQPFADVQAPGADEEGALLLEGPVAVARCRPRKRRTRAMFFWRNSTRPSRNCRRNNARCSSRMRSRDEVFKQLAGETGVSVNTLLFAQALCRDVPAPPAAGHL